jgi:ribosome-associated heat shock protein Hsp15
LYAARRKLSVTDGTSPQAQVRTDKWLWAARFFKTRALAADAIDAGRVEINDERIKRSRLVHVGDRIRIRRPPFEQSIVVLALSDTRGPAPVAATLYEETPDSRKAREYLAAQLRAAGPPVFRDKGRPGKKDRREIDRWRGRSDT